MHVSSLTFFIKPNLIYALLLPREPKIAATYQFILPGVSLRDMILKLNKNIILIMLQGQTAQS